MKTKHTLVNSNSNNLNFIQDGSINLVVTSPPYPMIEMWDDIFSLMNPKIKYALHNNEGTIAFELMHKELDKVWDELYRVTAPGGIVCINIGDATRTINENFQIFMNGSRIITHMTNLGFYNLPRIIWRKATNSPNKFMGSGMFPGGAYVTLEHEHILIFRKGQKRVFKGRSLIERRESAYFREERNIWISDIWNIKGERQKSMSGENRERTAAYPLELPLRIINMYSKYGDTILDPFFGTGTTSVAAMMLARNSIGVDIDASFLSPFKDRIRDLTIQANDYFKKRIYSHKEFLQSRKEPLKYFATNLNTPVMTNQEVNIQFYEIDKIDLENENEFIVKHTVFKDDSLV